MFLKANNSSKDNISRSTSSHQNVRLKSINNQETNEDGKNENVKTIFNNSSSASKTILITNNIQPKGNSKAPGSSDNSSSITILTSHDGDDSEVLNDNDNEVIGDDSSKKSRQTTQRSTVVLDRINICINNHYNEPLIQGSTTSISSPIHNIKYENYVKKDEPDSTVPTPPSKDGDLYNHGQDVLVLQKDGCLYLGSVIAIARNQCLVKFGDNTERWASFNELSKLNSSDVDNSPFCVVCKENNSSDIVEVCEKCGRGYHEKCMDGVDVGPNGIWYCRRCTAQNTTHFRNRYSKNNEDDKKTMCSSDSTKKRCNLILYHKNQLPYNVSYIIFIYCIILLKYVSTIF